MSSVVAQRTSGRTLISNDLFERLAARISREEQCERLFAERIMDQALAYLAACAHNRGTPLSPSEMVDIGWHAFILYTRDYADFCQRVAGRFIHHVPTDGESESDGGSRRNTLLHTVESIRAVGFTVDDALWFTGNAAACDKCSQCKNGCHDDPPPPPLR